MQTELENYGNFVIYHGMYTSCNLSKKSPDFLLQALYSVVGKTKATEFFLTGLKNLIEDLGEDQILSQFDFTKETLTEIEKASQWVTEQENMVYFANLKKLQDKHTKLNHIDKYKNLELNKSIIFKHLKSVD